MKLKLATALVLMTSMSLAHAAGDAAAGKVKTATCMACHMTDGNSVNPIWPKLAGQHESYLVKQLNEFKSGLRKDPTMTAMSMALSEQDVEDVSAFFASNNTSIGTAEKELVETGEKIYKAGIKDGGVAACMGCHGPSGAGNPGAKFPSLRGQHAAYVTKALKDFRTGLRSNDPSSMMRDITAKMSDSEIAAVASYIQGLN
ncbi:MAG: cytochrome c4 [Gammaproteobacteria bacterium]|nr:cytochrome c4 [Gammaproteobacteria bacterium]